MRDTAQTCVVVHVLLRLPKMYFPKMHFPGDKSHELAKLNKLLIRLVMTTTNLCSANLK